MLEIERAHYIHYGGAKCSRASMERKRLLNAKTTASRHRKWQEVKLEREESARREALEILELRRKERARLSEYIHRAVQTPAKPKTQRNFNRQEKGGHKKPRWNSSALVEDRETDSMRTVSKTPSINHVHGGRIHIADRLFLLKQAHELRTTTSTPQSADCNGSVGSKGQRPCPETEDDYCNPWTGIACDAYDINGHLSCKTVNYSTLDLDDDGYYRHRELHQVTEVDEDTLMTESSVGAGYVAGTLTAYPGGFALPKVLNIGYSELRKRNQDGVCCEKQLSREEFFETEATSVLESSQQVFVSRSTSPSISVANSGNEMACNCSSPQEDHRSPASKKHAADVPNTLYNRNSLRDEIVTARLANEAATARLIAEVTAIQSRLEDCNHPEPLDFGDDEAEVVMEQARTRPEVDHPTPTLNSVKHDSHVLLEECTCSHKDGQGTIQVHNRAMTGQLSDSCNSEPQFNSAVAALTAYCISPSDEQGYKRARGAQGQIKITRDAIQNWVPTHQKFVSDNSKLQTQTDNSQQAAAREAPSGETKNPAYTAWEIGWGGQVCTQQRQPPPGPNPEYLAPLATNVPAMNTPKFPLNHPQRNPTECNIMRQGDGAKQSTPARSEQPSESCTPGRQSKIQLSSSEASRNACGDLYSKPSQLHTPPSINHEDSRETFEVHQVKCTREFQAPQQPDEKMRNPIVDKHIKVFREPPPRQLNHPKNNEECFVRGPVGESGVKGMPMSTSSDSGRPDEIQMSKQTPFCTVQDSRPSTALPPRDYCLAPQLARPKFFPGKKDNHEHAPPNTILSEEERSILASLEKLDIKLAAVSARISKSACNSVVSDGGANSVRSAPTVMAPPSTFPGSSLMSLGSRPRKCCVMNPPSPMTPQAPRPFKGLQRRMVGLTNNCKQNSQSPPLSKETTQHRKNFMINPRTGGDILLHQFPHQCFDDLSRTHRQ